ncbi:gamma-glutamyl-gamma-aminobutyrate hydrolase family protein [Inquilinus limosus]|uniref:gamma-glutamyl-gamma-aminobutyrate hydrolase family protein n=1 Tax=Inquilinus limosus TaxID=171674 RepID=UPI003F163DF6
MPTAKPVIGVTLDAEEAGGYSSSPWYALRQNYCGSLAEFGAAPLALPHLVDAVDRYLDLCDGIVVTGGGFDVDPMLWGAGSVHETVKTKPVRTQFEWALVRGAVARNLPVLGICGGEQLLAVVLGGTLVQHIPAEIDNALEHSPERKIHDPAGWVAAHEVEVTPGTLLARITGAARFGVNSSHHQAVKAAGPDLVVSGVAPDGVVEAVEHPGQRFCLGVQWHPEYLRSEADRAILAAFVAACAG